MKTLCNLAAILLAAAAVNSCSNVDPVSPEEIKIPEKGLFAVVDNPVPFDDTGTTKAINTAMKFEWTGTEKIDVYTSTAGEKMTYRVKSYDNTANSCVFKILNFGLLDDTYYAMIPAQGLEDDPEAVPVTILGQNQSVDNNTAHLTKYDYNVASAEVVDNNGSFAFSHRVCWVKSTLTIPDACTAKSVTLTSGENAFVTDGYLNVVTDMFTPTAYASSITLNLGGADGIEVAAGGTLTVYFTLFSCTSEDLTISLDAVKNSEPATYSSPVKSIKGMPSGAYATRNAIFTSDGLMAVAQIGSTYYSSLDAAFAAVNNDETITILVNGDYTLPASVTKSGVTLEAATGISAKFAHTTAGNICGLGSGITFKNLTFDFGAVNYHGFQHAGEINMVECTINGKLFSYGDMNFTGCTFNAPAGPDYSMWCYGGDLYYKNCTFNGTGKYLNVYNEGSVAPSNITVDGCTFVNTAASKKAPVLIKAKCGATDLKYIVTIKGTNTLTGNFPTGLYESDVTAIAENGVWAVEDDGTPSGTIRVYEETVLVYPTSVTATTTNLGTWK